MPVNYFPIGATNVFLPCATTLTRIAFPLTENGQDVVDLCQNWFGVSCKGKLSVKVTGTVLVLSPSRYPCKHDTYRVLLYGTYLILLSVKAA